MTPREFIVSDSFLR